MANSSGGSSIGLGTLLGVLFIGLKLGGIIDWSWVWVLAPFWIGFLLFCVTFVVFIIAAALTDSAVTVRRKR